jgi:hypothetical protein
MQPDLQRPQVVLPRSRAATRDTPPRQSSPPRPHRIFELWLACHSGAEIAKATGLSEGEISKTLESFQTAGLPDGNKPAAAHLTDFDVPLYNVWKQQSKTEGSKHFGNSEVRWVDNLLYLYTQPFDIVVNPFAGGGDP